MYTEAPQRSMVAVSVNAISESVARRIEYPAGVMNEYRSRRDRNMPLDGKEACLNEHEQQHNERSDNGILP